MKNYQFETEYPQAMQMVEPSKAQRPAVFSSPMIGEGEVIYSQGLGFQVMKDGKLVERKGS